MATKPKKNTPPTRHNIDRRADQVIADSNGGDDDDMLSSQEVANWLGVSIQWVEIGRTKKWGPKFHKLSPRKVKYRRGDVRAWLNERKFANTSEYAA